VKELALQNNIKVYQPQTLRGEEFDALLKEIAPDIIVLAAYGKILPKNVIDYPEYGCINIHASLLPKYRGASPINAAIMHGEKVTGITIMHMAEGIDTGDMILKGEVEIGEDDNFGTVHDKLAVLGGELIVEALKQIKTGTAKREKQPEDGVSYVKKIENEMCEIDWNLPAKNIHDKIRGLSPVPTAFTWLNRKKLKIYKSKISEADLTGEYKNGEVININKIIEVKTCDKIIELLELQIEGGIKMSAGDFINGRKIEKGMILGG
jgi:methionyl-tRNA formyltransferase